MSSTRRPSNSATAGDLFIATILLIFITMCLLMPVTVIEGTKFGDENVSIDFHYSYETNMINYLVSEVKIAYRNYKYEGPRVVKTEGNIITVRDEGMKYIYLR